jgi:hypothetical protein
MSLGGTGYRKFDASLLPVGAVAEGGWLKLLTCGVLGKARSVLVLMLVLVLKAGALGLGIWVGFGLVEWVGAGWVLL